MSEERPKTPARGLGRGLSALLEDAPRDGAIVGDGPRPREVGVDRLRRNPQQPRKSFHEADLNALAESIRTHGVVQPLLVRPVQSEAGHYEIVAGERRWRAAQIAGLHVVPVLVRELDDLATLEVSIVENLQRADLDPIEEALAFQQLLDRFGRTQQSVADAVGKSRAHVANTLRLLTLPESVKDMVRSGALSAGHARAALAADDPAEAARLMVARGLSVRDAEKLVQASGRRKPPAGVSRETRDGDHDAAALAADLSAALGLEVSIQHDARKGGAITVSYKTLEQLDDLCRRLTAGAR